LPGQDWIADFAFSGKCLNICAICQFSGLMQHFERGKFDMRYLAASACALVLLGTGVPAQQYMGEGGPEAGSGMEGSEEGMGSESGTQSPQTGLESPETGLDSPETGLPPVEGSGDSGSGLGTSGGESGSGLGTSGGAMDSGSGSIGD
jgi:hypothetical protein